MLYHLALTMEKAAKVFADVQVIVLGGYAPRMLHFAQLLSKRTGEPVENMGEYRYVFYKVGRVAILNHGMGGPSISILLNELIKGLRAAKNFEAIFFRIGSCGGIGVPPGTIVATSRALNQQLEPYYELIVLGKVKKYLAEFDQDLMKMLCTYDGVVQGNTVSANCFYEGQGRLDGAFCDYTEADKMEYLRAMDKLGVKNIEMEGVALAAMTRRANYRAAMLCVTLVNRLEGDMPTHQLVDESKNLDILVDVIVNKKFLKSAHL